MECPGCTTGNRDEQFCFVLLNSGSLQSEKLASWNCLVTHALHVFEGVTYSFNAARMRNKKGVISTIMNNSFNTRQGFHENRECSTPEVACRLDKVYLYP